MQHLFWDLSRTKSFNGRRRKLPIQIFFEKGRENFCCCFDWSCAWAVFGFVGLFFEFFSVCLDAIQPQKVRLSGVYFWLEVVEEFAPFDPVKVYA